MDIFYKELTLIVLYQQCNEINIRKSYLPCKNEKITKHNNAIEEMGYFVEAVESISE